METSDNTMDSFGRTLRHLRKEQDLTQEGLLGELKEKGCEILSKSTISKWENGWLKPKMETVKDLEEVFQVPRGSLLRAAGYLVETSPEQLDPVMVKQRGEHFAALASVAKTLLTNGLDSVSSPRWGRNRSGQARYRLPNENAASGYDELTEEQLTRHLDNNTALALRQHGDWFFRDCFVPHLKSEMPKELETEPLFNVVEKHPYKLIICLCR